jgi:hypothetical protein
MVDMPSIMAILSCLSAKLSLQLGPVDPVDRDTRDELEIVVGLGHRSEPVGADNDVTTADQVFAVVRGIMKLAIWLRDGAAGTVIGPSEVAEGVVLDGQDLDQWFRDRGADIKVVPGDPRQDTITPRG